MSIAGHTSHVTRSGNRACFMPRVNSFAIKSFFYTGIKLGLYTSVLPEVSQPTEKCFPLKWNYKP